MRGRVVHCSFPPTKRLEVKPYLPELRGDIGVDHSDLPTQENELLLSVFLGSQSGAPLCGMLGLVLGLGAKFPMPGHRSRQILA